MRLLQILLLTLPNVIVCQLLGGLVGNTLGNVVDGVAGSTASPLEVGGDLKDASASTVKYSDSTDLGSRDAVEPHGEANNVDEMPDSGAMTTPDYSSVDLTDEPDSSDTSTKSPVKVTFGVPRKTPGNKNIPNENEAASKVTTTNIGKGIQADSAGTTADYFPERFTDEADGSVSDDISTKSPMKVIFGMPRKPQATNLSNSDNLRTEDEAESESRKVGEEMLVTTVEYFSEGISSQTESVNGDYGSTKSPVKVIFGVPNNAKKASPPESKDLDNGNETGRENIGEGGTIQGTSSPTALPNSSSENLAGETESSVGDTSTKSPVKVIFGMPNKTPAKKPPDSDDLRNGNEVEPQPTSKTISPEEIQSSTSVAKREDVKSEFDSNGSQTTKLPPNVVFGIPNKSKGNDEQNSKNLGNRNDGGSQAWSRNNSGNQKRISSTWATVETKDTTDTVYYENSGANSKRTRHHGHGWKHKEKKYENRHNNGRRNGQKKGLVGGLLG